MVNTEECSKEQTLYFSLQSPIYPHDSKGGYVECGNI